MGETETPFNLLALSDVHLGAALKSRRPAPADDAALVAWLDHHARHPQHDRPWRLVLVGDVFDFVSVLSIPALGAAPFPVSADEQRFGLEAEEAKSVWKLECIAAHHPAAFSALRRFVAAGHALVFVRGNHDLELAWPAVQQALRARLAAPGEAEASTRVEFRDRAYLEPGRAYFENGHAYDCFCLPAPPSAGEQIMPWPVSSLVLRYFGNRHCPQDMIETADAWGARDFVRWFFGTRAPWRVASDYAAMVLRLLALGWKSPRSPRCDPLEPLREQLVGAGPFHARKPAKLSGLSVEPALHSVLRVMQLFYLERIALVLGAPLLMLLAARAWPGPVGSGVGLGIALATGALFPMLARLRRTESRPLLERAAGPLAELFGVPLVVMGHTHRAESVPAGAGATYVNLGSWTHPSPRGFPYLMATAGEAGLRHWPAAPEPARELQVEPAAAWAEAAP